MTVIFLGGGNIIFAVAMIAAGLPLLAAINAVAALACFCVSWKGA